MNIAFPILGLIYVVVVLVALGMGFYIAYLSIRALRKYLRS